VPGIARGPSAAAATDGEAPLAPQAPWACTRIVGLAGYSGSGKTTLISKVIPRLRARGLTISTIKHTHHGFDLDQPGKDSFVHRAAGATEVVISSAKRFAIMHELRAEQEWELPDLVLRMSPVDLVLVEGYKRDPIPKIEVHRAANSKGLIHPDDPSIFAIAADVRIPGAKVPSIDLDDLDGIANLLWQFAIPVTDMKTSWRMDAQHVSRPERLLP
jgi:molybdopterin-guanine dinucleotide biosynthesis protein B